MWEANAAIDRSIDQSIYPTNYWHQIYLGGRGSFVTTQIIKKSHQYFIKSGQIPFVLESQTKLFILYKIDEKNKLEEKPAFIFDLLFLWKLHHHLRKYQSKSVRNGNKKQRQSPVQVTKWPHRHEVNQPHYCYPNSLPRRAWQDSNAATSYLRKILIICRSGTTSEWKKAPSFVKISVTLFSFFVVYNAWCFAAN